MLSRVGFVFGVSLMLVCCLSAIESAFGFSRQAFVRDCLRLYVALSEGILYEFDVVDGSLTILCNPIVGCGYSICIRGVTWDGLAQHGTSPCRLNVAWHDVSTNISGPYLARHESLGGFEIKK